MSNERIATRSEKFARLIPVFIVLFTLGYGIAAYAFLYIPKLGRLVPGGDLDIQPYDTRLTEARNYGRAMENITAHYAKVTPEDRMAIAGMAPAGADTQSLYPIIGSLAAKYNLLLDGISAGGMSKEMTETGLVAATVTFNVRGGTYSTYRAFLAALELERRIIDVDSVVFSNNSDSFSVTGRAYVFSPDRLTIPPIPPPADAAPEPAPEQ